MLLRLVAILIRIGAQSTAAGQDFLQVESPRSSTSTHEPDVKPFNGVGDRPPPSTRPQHFVSSSSTSTAEPPESDQPGCAWQDGSPGDGVECAPQATSDAQLCVRPKSNRSVAHGWGTAATWARAGPPCAGEAVCLGGGQAAGRFDVNIR